MGQGIQHSTFYGYDNVYPLRNLEWEDVRVPVQNLKVPVTKNPDWVSFKGGQVLSFEDQAVEANEERVYFLCQFPHRMSPGTNIQPHIHWVSEDQTAGDVVWKLSYTWANEFEEIPAETEITVVSPVNTAIADYHKVSDFAQIDGTGKKFSSLLICSLRRNSNNVLDTYAGKNALLLEVDIHFQVDRPGTTTVHTQ
jgi:hypothetical protein